MVWSWNVPTRFGAERTLAGDYLTSETLGTPNTAIPIRTSVEKQMRGQRISVPASSAARPNAHRAYAETLKQIDVESGVRRPWEMANGFHCQTESVRDGYLPTDDLTWAGCSPGISLLWAIREICVSSSAV
jgi:hypothetical protein